MKNAVFLIGNDINNAKASYTWENLLKDLTKHASLKTLPNMLNKPFPLVYEEIILKTLAVGKIQENELKKFIASKIELLKPTVFIVQLLIQVFSIFLLQIMIIS